MYRIDSLTGLYNRRGFALAYQKMLEKEQNKLPLTIILADLDRLKYINDNFGHKAGDDYIKAACRMICEVFDHSPVYRIGGDEFVAILKGQDRERRHELMAVLDSRSAKNIGSDKGPVIACGLSDYLRGEDEEFRTVFNRADHAMYIRKDQLKEMGSKSR
jgi:diguanylate cyclase (GGDEF)-like protein